jgi:hypothetical protein
LTALGLEVNTYRYFAATILQFLGPEPPDEKLRTAADPRSDKASFEMLARARLLFAQGPVLAWKMISDFRHAHDLEVLAAPDPCWLAVKVDSKAGAQHDQADGAKPQAS